MKKLAVFDFDSTLIQGETIEILASIAGVQEKVKKITDLAMRGELDFFESLNKRVSFLKDIEVSKINEICKNLPYTKGAKETITELKKRGYLVVCLSGGFKNATIQAQKILGYDEEFSNILHEKNGLLTGLVGGEMLFDDSKGKILLKLQNILNITPQNTIAVGDGANDLSMFKYSQTKIAFCAKNILKNAADISIDTNDLTDIFNFL